MYLFFIYNVLFGLSLFSQIAFGTPVTKEKIKQALKTQDKLCSLEFEKDDGSYQRIFETVTGWNMPTPMKEYDKKLYTGFKFLRTYNFQFLSLILDYSLKVVFCNEGKVQWEKNQPLQDDVDWDIPLCVYTPEPTNKGDIIKGSIFDRQTRKGNRTVQLSHSLKVRAQNDLSNFHCFKLARRKKYTNRRVSLFFPRSWVGGIFYCNLDDDMKKNTLLQMNSNLVFFNNKGHHLCTQNNSIPLVPLQSDDYGKNWIEYKGPGLFSVFGKFPKFEVTKYVPYLFTPNIPIAIKPSDFATTNSLLSTWKKPWREQLVSIFQTNSLLSNTKEPWFSEIEVEEKYDLSSEEISNLGDLAHRTTYKIITIAGASQNSAKSFLSTAVLDEPKGKSRSILKKILDKMELKIWSHLMLLDKSIAIMGGNTTNLKDLESEWKNLKMNVKKYNYSIPN